MAILDSELDLSLNQAVTVTTISTNVYDTQPSSTANPLQNIGIGTSMYLVVETTSTVTDAGSDATITVELLSDSTADLATSPTVHYSSGAIPFNLFSAVGSRLSAVALPSTVPYERYVGVRYTVGSGPLTAGTFNARLQRYEPQNSPAYATGN